MTAPELGPFGSETAALDRRVLRHHDRGSGGNSPSNVEAPPISKMVITSKTVNSAPQYTLVVKKWETGVEPAPDAFAFVPPQGAKKREPLSA